MYKKKNANTSTLFLAVLLLTGCSSYQKTENSDCYPHPSNPYISVCPVRLPKTLDIEEEYIPKGVEKEPEMHHMQHEKHSLSEKEHSGGGNV